MEKSAYEPLFPPLVTSVHDQAVVDQQTAMLKQLGAVQVPRAELEAAGVTEMAPASRPWAFKPAEVGEEKAADLRKLAGPQFKEENAAAWELLKQRQAEKAPVQERAAQKVGKPAKDDRSFARLDILENGVQVFVLKSERDEFKGMMEKAGFAEAQVFNQKNGVTKVAHELETLAPELFKAVVARFNGEGREAAWASQPEIAALSKSGAERQNDKNGVRGYAASMMAKFAVATPLSVGRDPKDEKRTLEIERYVAEGIAMLPSRVLDARVALSEEATKKYQYLHDQNEVTKKLRGHDIVTPEAAARHEANLVGAEMGRVELAKRARENGYVREFDGLKGVVPSDAQMKEIFGDAYKAPQRAASAGQRKGPAAAPAAEAKVPAKANSAGGRTRKPAPRAGQAR